MTVLLNFYDKIHFHYHLDFQMPNLVRISKIFKKPLTLGKRLHFQCPIIRVI